MKIQMSRISKAKAFLLVCASLLVFVSCQTALQQDTSQGQEEAAIVSVLTDWQNTWNADDTEGNLALINENAKIMYGRDRNIASKDEYRKILEGRPKESPKLTLGQRVINTNGNTAEVKADLTIGNYTSPYFFTLVNDNGRWTIMSWRY